MNSILLVEDNEGISEGLKFSFEMSGRQIKIAKNIKEARDFVANETPGLVLLDVSLPDGNGFDFYENELSKAGITTIFLTARDEENDIVRGFDLGAEDYITKPFSTRELMARVNRVLKKQDETSSVTISGITFDFSKGEVSKKVTDEDGTSRQEIIALSSLEKKILQLLFENANRVVNRNAVIDCIWDATGNDVYDHTVTVYMKRIREKLGVDIITTVKGIGYRIDT